MDLGALPLTARVGMCALHTRVVWASGLHPPPSFCDIEHFSRRHQTGLEDTVLMVDEFFVWMFYSAATVSVLPDIWLVS